MEEYKVLEMFGSNLVSAEGDTWKRHRKICSPTYSEVSTPSPVMGLIFRGTTLTYVNREQMRSFGPRRVRSYPTRLQNGEINFGVTTSPNSRSR